MYLSDQIRRAARNLRSAKARTILTSLAIAVGAFALTLTLAASNGAQAFVGDIIADNFDPAELIVVADEATLGGGDTSKPVEYDESFGTAFSNAGAVTQIKRLTAEDIDKIASLDSVESVREDIAVNASYIAGPNTKKYVATIAALNPYQKPELLAGTIANPLPDDQIILPEGFVSALGFSSADAAVGKTITVALQNQAATNPTAPAATELKNYKVSAVLKKPTTAQPGTELYLFVNQTQAGVMNDFVTQGTANYQKYISIYARAKNGGDAQSLQKAQDDIENLGFYAQSVKETQDFLNQIIGVLQGIVAAFGFIAIIASVFGIVNTMYISVISRTREIGLMKALGMRKRDIGRLFRFEAAWIGFLGGVLGSILAVGLGILLNPWITKQLDLGEGKQLLIFQPVQIVGLIVILMIISILAGWLPSRKAAKLDPIEALRTE